MDIELNESVPKRQTIPLLFYKRFKEDPEEIAFYHKDFGIYRGVCWSQYWREVELFYLGLLVLGVKQGDRVVIMGDPCPELFYADLAVLSAGAISSGVYSSSSPEETASAIERTEATFFITEGLENADKILPFVDKLPFLLKIIVTDRRSAFHYTEPRLIGFADVQELGKKRKIDAPEQFLQAIQQPVPDDPAIIAFTPGTTDSPKPAVFSHKNVVSFLYSISEVFPGFLTHEQRAVGYEGLAHPMGRFISIYFPLLYDFKIYFGETVESFQETLYEVQPTFFYGMPRIWKKLASRILVAIDGNSWPKVLACRWGMRIGRRYMQMKWEKKRVNAVWQLLRWAAEQISFRHIRHQLGFPKTTCALSIGGPLPAHIQDLWQIWGVDLLNCYSCTEAVGIISTQVQGFPKSGNLGKPLSIYRTRLAEDGELLLSGQGVFCGYWKDEVKTREVMQDGWLCTGDIFEYGEDESLKFVDRKQDIVITSEGARIVPTRIQNFIKSSPYITDAVIFVGKQDLISVVIEIDFETVAEWARKNNVLGTGLTGLVHSPEVHELIEKEVRSAIQDLPQKEQLKDIQILAKALHPDTGEITATGKMRRHLIREILETG